MVSMNLGSVALFALDRIHDVPTTVSGLPMERMATTIIEDLKNWSGESISTTDIPVKYQNILINLTAAYTLSFMAGVGVAHDVSLGEFRVAGNGQSSPEIQSMQMFLNEANSRLKQISRKMYWGKAFG